MLKFILRKYLKHYPEFLLLRLHFSEHIAKRAPFLTRCQTCYQQINRLFLPGSAHIWKRTVEKSQRNATNVILHPHWQVIWGNILKHTVEKNLIDATNPTMYHFIQAIWGHTGKQTVEKSSTNATNATMPLLRQGKLGQIWRHTLEKWRKVKQM